MRKTMCKYSFTILRVKEIVSRLPERSFVGGIPAATKATNRRRPSVTHRGSICSSLAKGVDAEGSDLFAGDFLA